MLAQGGGSAEQAAGALMNLASNDADNQAAIMAAGALKPLVAILRDGASSRRAREYVAGALMNLTLRQPSTQAEVAAAGAIPLLASMLSEAPSADAPADAAHAGDIDGRGYFYPMEEVAGALTNLADSNDANQRAVVAAGAIPPLVALLGDASASHREEAAGTLMNLAACDDNKGAIVGATPLGPLVRVRSRMAPTPRRSTRRARSPTSPTAPTLTRRRSGGRAPCRRCSPRSRAAAGAPEAPPARRRRRRAARGQACARAPRRRLALSTQRANGDAARRRGRDRTLVGALARGVWRRRAG